MPSGLETSVLAALLLSPVIGSFAATLGLRLALKREVVFARSACDHCGTKLGPADLVPLASYALRRGRCRHCGAAIDWLHPAAELGAVLVTVSAAFAFQGAAFWFACGLGWLLLAQAVADLRHFVLPDEINLAILLLGGAALAWLAPAALPDGAAGVAAGFATLALVGWAYRRLRGRDGLGLGDAKLLGASGVWIGWLGLPSAILIAALSGTLLALAMAVAGRTVNATTEVPFGPHLALGAWIVFLRGPLAFG